MDAQAYPERSQATTALVLGIVGIFFTVVAPFAWKFGHDELKAIDEGRRPPDGHGQATAGRILGIIGTVFLVVGLVVLALVMAFVIPVSVTSSEAADPPISAHMGCLKGRICTAREPLGRLTSSRTW